MKLAILLTATIKPQCVGGNFTVSERAEMYASTLRYYAATIGRRYPIIFLENSDYDLSALRNEFAGNDLLDIEFIQFSPTDSLPFNQSRGKGYNEYLMIKGGVQKSEKLAGCTHFLKITGRYAMLNITSMIHEIEQRGKKKSFMGDVKDTDIYQWIGSRTLGHWGDSRFWMASTEYYKKSLMDCYVDMDDCVWGKWAEDFFLQLSRKERRNPDFIFRFRTQVLFNGITGTGNSSDLVSGRHRQDSRKARFKARVRGVLRVLFPFVWF